MSHASAFTLFIGSIYDLACLNSNRAKPSTSKTLTKSPRLVRFMSFAAWHLTWPLRSTLATPFYSVTMCRYCLTFSIEYSLTVAFAVYYSVWVPSHWHMAGSHSFCGDPNMRQWDQCNRLLGKQVLRYEYEYARMLRAGGWVQTATTSLSEVLNFCMTTWTKRSAHTPRGKLRLLETRDWGMKQVVERQKSLEHWIFAKISSPKN